MASNDLGGVWRTVGGRRIFIKDGQDLADAMIQSGKFKNLRSDYRKAKEEENQKVEVPGFKNYEYDTKTGEVKVKGYDENEANEKANEMRNKLNENRGENESSKNERKALGKGLEQIKEENAIKENEKQVYDKLGSSKEDNKRMEIAKDIAKELNPSLKSASEERLEREARELLKHNDGEVLEKGETTYTNQKGELERSTDSLKKWRDDLQKIK